MWNSAEVMVNHMDDRQFLIGQGFLPEVHLKLSIIHVRAVTSPPVCGVAFSVYYLIQIQGEFNDIVYQVFELLRLTQSLN